MAQTKFAEFSKLSRDELVQKIATLRDETIMLARSTKMGDVQNVRAHIWKRRELAKALTALSQADSKGDN